ncbi:MAG TPA: Gfo/Idh/MocA family oxidoreductase [Candidatus Sulfotelmatobacter sp.]|nr:Gfo/Idh/MocA family oxidoreductase [Candidatus Sulfotelmatobacter sp.]
MNSSEPAKVGVIGCGYWGKNLVRVFSELGALAGVCDADAGRAAELGKTYNVPATNQPEDLLGAREIAGVAIAAPAAQHFSLAKQALLAGKDVFVEKPLALRLEDGEELVGLAQRQSRVLMVGHLLHYHPAIVALGNMIREGELGRIEYISSSRLNLGRLRTEEDILWSFAPHDISAIVHLLKEDPSNVAAQGASYLNHQISDVTLTILSFASGVKAHIFVSWLHPFKEQKLVVVGSQKMAVFDDTQAETKLVVYPHRIEWVDRVPVARRMEGQVVPLPKEEPLKNECEHFLERVRDRKRPNTDGENGLRVLRILHMASESIRRHGEPVPFKSKPRPDYYVDPSAIVEQPCEVGEGTKIWHFSHVMPKCKIGRHCNLGQNVHVASGVRIGNNVKIQNNVSLYAGVELEDDVFCGPSMVFTNVITPRSHVNRHSEYQKTLVKRGATLGANSTIVCGVNVGRYAFIGAGAVVTKDVPDHALMVGVPARQIGWSCECGVRLQPTGDLWTCEGCGAAYVLADGVLSAASTSYPPSAEMPAALGAAAGEN